MSGDGISVAADTASTPWVAIINETLARRFWPGENPIGKRFTVDAISGERVREVIGVVRDVPLQYVHYRSWPVAYTLYRQQAEQYEGWNAGSFGSMTFFLRRNDDPLSLVPAVRKAVAEVDPNRPPADFQTMTAFVGRGMRTRGFYVSMLGLFALMATVLAAASIYGVMTFSARHGARAGNLVVTASGTALRSLRSVVFGNCRRTRVDKMDRTPALESHSDRSCNFCRRHSPIGRRVGGCLFHSGLESATHGRERLLKPDDASFLGQSGFCREVILGGPAGWDEGQVGTNTRARFSGKRGLSLDLPLSSFLIFVSCTPKCAKGGSSG